MVVGVDKRKINKCHVFIFIRDDVECGWAPKYDMLVAADNIVVDSITTYVKNI